MTPMGIGFSFILIFGMVVNLIILFILNKHEDKELHTKLLFALFLEILVIQLNLLVIANGLDAVYPFMNLLSDVMVLAMAPTFLGYVQSIFGVYRSGFGNAFLHFVPAALYFLFIYVPFNFGFFMDNDFFGFRSILERNYGFLVLVINVYALVYLRAAHRVLKTKVRAFKSYYSNFNRLDIEWIGEIIIGAMLILGLDLVFIVIEFFFESFVMVSNYIVFGSISILVSFLCYKGIRQTGLIVPEYFLNHEGVKESVTHAEETSPPMLADPEHLKHRLIEVMDAERPFLEEELTLHRLSEITAIPEKKLSILLNHYMDTNFYDFINSYRVRAVKDMLRDTDNRKFTLMGIANDCGFKSKSTFNRIFKRETGLSPGEYQRSIDKKTGY